jgi:hypothetical protein
LPCYTLASVRETGLKTIKVESRPLIEPPLSAMRVRRWRIVSGLSGHVNLLFAAVVAPV